MTTIHAALVTTGGTLDLVGIVLVAAPEVFPVAGRFSSRVDLLVRTSWNRFRRLVGLPPRGRVYVDEGTVTSQSSGSGVEVFSISNEAGQEQKIAFLIERLEELQQRLGTLENTVRDLPKQWQGDLAHVRLSLEQFVRSEIEHTRETHIRTRLAGIGCLLVGSSLLSIANLV